MSPFILDCVYKICIDGGKWIVFLKSEALSNGSSQLVLLYYVLRMGSKVSVYQTVHN